MSDSSANLSLPYILPSQAQKHVTHNEALAVLDTVVQLAVIDRDRTVPPDTPDPGARHLVAVGATGAWAGRDGMIATWDGTAWRFLAPKPGWRSWVSSEAIDLVWQDGAWSPPPAPPLDDLDRVGVNTAADAVNRLAVAAETTLLTHEGAGHQLKINKAAPGDTASLLFQSGWSGRAEMGLAGTDGWSIKVSPDGTGWTEALALDSATGRASGAAVQSDSLDTTPGRLLKVGAFGLGDNTVNAGTPPDNDCDLAVVTGWYDVENDTLNGPLGQAGVLFVQARNPQRRIQTLYRIAGNNTVEPFSRVSYGNGTLYSPWVRSYNQDTILGMVSQSSGNPTGALIERGSNANGDYVRFADGTQICTAEAVTVNVEAVGQQSFSYPATFVAPPSVSASHVTNLTNPSLRYSNIESLHAGTGAWNLNLLSAGTSSDPSSGMEKMTFSAIGRWF